MSRRAGGGGALKGATPPWRGMEVGPAPLTLAPIWLPHWPAWMWTISLMAAVESGGGARAHPDGAEALGKADRKKLKRRRGPFNSGAKARARQRRKWRRPRPRARSYRTKPRLPLVSTARLPSFYWLILPSIQQSVLPLVKLPVSSSHRRSGSPGGPPRPVSVVSR